MTESDPFDNLGLISYHSEHAEVSYSTIEKLVENSVLAAWNMQLALVSICWSCRYFALVLLNSDQAMRPIFQRPQE